MGENSQYAELGRARYLALTTFRGNGARVSTPVWAAPADDGRELLYVFTGAGTGKMKRIRRNLTVEIAECTMRGKVRGPVVAARATILPRDQHAVADHALTRKYPLAKRLLDLFNRRRPGQRAYLALELVPELAVRQELKPAGHQSAATAVR